MKISEHIYNHLKLGCRKEDVSPMETLDDYFSQIPDCDEESWPLLPADDAVKINYSKAKVQNDRFGFGSFIDIVSNVKIGKAELTIVENIEAEESLKIEIGSIIRKGETSCGNYVFDLIRRHREFMQKFDKQQLKQKIISRSELVLNADSKPTGNPVTNGGYTWATHGFNFASNHERLSAQKAFKAFAAQHEVIIEDKDLKLFAKPCHFAAFQCGVKVDGKNLGKAFLLQYSWYGKMQVSAQGSATEEYRYAMAYHLNRAAGNHVQKSAMELNKKYLRMMKKYHDQYNTPKKEPRGIFTKLGERFTALSYAFKR